MSMNNIINFFNPPSHCCQCKIKYDIELWGKTGRHGEGEVLSFPVKMSGQYFTRVAATGPVEIPQYKLRIEKAVPRKVEKEAIKKALAQALGYLQKNQDMPHLLITHQNEDGSWIAGQKEGYFSAAYPAALGALILSGPFRKYGGIRVAMYPLSLRCSSVKYDKGIRPPRALRERFLATLGASPYLRKGPLRLICNEEKAGQ